MSKYITNKTPFELLTAAELSSNTVIMRLWALKRNHGAMSPDEFQAELEVIADEMKQSRRALDTIRVLFASPTA